MSGPFAVAFVDERFGFIASKDPFCAGLLVGGGGGRSIENASGKLPGLGGERLFTSARCLRCNTLRRNL